MRRRRGWKGRSCPEREGGGRDGVVLGKKGDAHHASAVQPMTRLAMDLSASGSAGREADMAMSFLTRSAGSEEDVGWSGAVMVGQSAALGEGGDGKKR